MKLMKRMGLLALVLGVALLVASCVTTPRGQHERTQRDLVVNFAQHRQRQMLAVAKDKQLEVPQLFNQLFEAVIRYDWPATSNLYCNIKGSIGQYAGSRSDPTLNNELWQYVLETFGAFEQVALWKPLMLQRYEAEVLRPLTTNCIYFGGTDPGRFVPTMLRETAAKLFQVITQNALADHLYMNFLRSSCAPSVVLPTPAQCNDAFRKLVEEVQAGRTPAGADVRVKDGRVSVEGVQGVMMINGLIAKWIFDQNKDGHDFFVEESYVLPWMYPYLAPAGIILKLGKEPLPTPQENDKFWKNLLYEDSTFWAQLLGELNKHPEFKSDQVGQRAFSKLRCASAGIYEYRGLIKAAEAAYQQAIAMCPKNPEASFRLANLYARMKRLDDAVKTLRTLSEQDPADTQVRAAIQQFEEAQRTPRKPASSGTTPQ